jgi:3-oxoacyl-[acyl-carrier-protein] synthase-1
MERALAAGGVAAPQIGHVNAHGTGTVQNDAMEALAIATLLDGGSASVVSTKGYTGHMLGAAGATEAVFALQALAVRAPGCASNLPSPGWVPASRGADPVDPAFDLEIPLKTLERDVEFVLSNSFAFGGSNVSVLFGAVGGNG